MLRFALLLLALVPALGTAQPNTTVRVRLMAPKPPSAATVTSSSPLVIRHSDGRSETLRDGEPLRLVIRGGRLVANGMEIVGEPLSIRSETALNVTAGSQIRSYSGDLTADADGSRLLLVNHVPMPDYVASVVSSEYPFSEIEGVKAQAVLARTYAARRQNLSQPYDVNDHEGAQVYKGAGVVTDRSRRAAEETLGERLYFGSDLADAVYSSSSGGYTADNESVWNGAPLPYLRGVPDPYDADAPDHRWTTTLQAREVHSTLSERFGGRVRDVTVIERSPEGRAVRIELAGSQVISGSQFRAALNAALGYRTVRSTFVELDRRGETYVLMGRGFGHGVGMSQYGARGQAREGRSYREILAYYFQGTTVERDPTASLTTRAPSRWPTPRRLDRSTGASETADSPPEFRRRPTPRREAHARDLQTRRGW